MSLPRPNLLFVVADDHRASARGALGIEPVRTPVLDALAERGAVLSQMRTMSGYCGAVCIPSRSCIHTGRDIRAVIAAVPDDSSMSGYQLPPHIPLLGETLRGQGYVTHGIGKWHNDSAAFNRSFASGAQIFFGGMSDHDKVPVHDYDPTGDYAAVAPRIASKFSTELFADAAVDFLQTHDAANPFFLYMALTSPHDPRTPPPPYDQIDPATIPLPPNFLPSHPFDNGEMKVRDEELAAFPRDPEEIRRHLAEYYGMIEHHDDHIGRILEILKNRGMLENTIVVYTADHGLGIGQHGLMGKQNLYEHSLRTPFLIAGPGMPAGREVSSPAMEMDILPTVLDVLGVPPMATVDGLSFADAIREGNVGPRRLGEALYGDYQHMLTDGRWKRIRYHRIESTGRGTDFLQVFDLESDPWEITNLSGDPAAMAEAARLEDWSRDSKML